MTTTTFPSFWPDSAGPVRLDDLVEREAPVDDRVQPASLDQASQVGQVLAVGPDAANDTRLPLPLDVHLARTICEKPGLAMSSHPFLVNNLTMRPDGVLRTTSKMTS